MLTSVLAAQELPSSLAPSSLSLPCDTERSSELAERAHTANKEGDAALAAGLFRQSFEVCPRQRELLLDVARALTSARNFDGAIAAAGEFLRSDPDSLAGRLALANTLLMAQKWEECGVEIERALKLGPDDRAALLLKANYAYLMGDSGQAEQSLLRILDLTPADEEAAYMLGRIYLMDSRVDYATALFQRVLKLNPSAYKAWDNLGLCYDAAGETDTAIRHFLTAIKLVEKDYPEYDWPYANLADLLLRQERDQEAYQAATMAAKRNPYSGRNFYLGGKALSKLGRMDDAIKWLERSAELDRAYPDPLYLLGQLYLKKGEKQKATEALSRFREVKAKAPTKRR
ncbi:MAG: tetratricopeptide repeat protein [Bryobacteraceae bacterium]|nr:tetratricopeptide repeat protein [Bryobacteraceae bacterium]